MGKPSGNDTAGIRGPVRGVRVMQGIDHSKPSRKPYTSLQLVEDH